MKTAIELGIKDGLDKSTLAEMVQRIVMAIREHDGEPTDPSIYERVQALEERAERHRRRIRWLERLAHWHGWFRPDPNP